MTTSSPTLSPRTGSLRIALGAKPKPRNPFVAAAQLRAAGRHGPDAGARRQRDRQALRHELAHASTPRWPRGEP